MAGNFCGVCPILNRATKLTGFMLAEHRTEKFNFSSCDSLLADGWLCGSEAMSETVSGKTECFFGYFIVWHETHGNV